MTAQYVEHYGKAFAVIAAFPETDRAAANAFMTANPGASLLCIRNGVAYLAHDSDHGSTLIREPVREAAPELRATLKRIVQDGVLTGWNLMAARTALARSSGAMAHQPECEELPTGKAARVLATIADMLESHPDYQAGNSKIHYCANEARAAFVALKGAA